MIGADFGWSPFGSLEHAVRTGTPAMEKVFPGGLFAYLSVHPDMGRVFNDATTAKSHADIAAIIPSYDFSSFGIVADIGGGRGHLLKAVIDSDPAMRGILFDLPLVVTNAAPIASERLSLQGGDFFKDALACTLALSPIRDTHSEGFSYFVTSIAAPAASGWIDCRVGLAPTGKRRLVTAHTRNGRSSSSSLVHFALAIFT
jgi:hypothetical protein